MPSLREQVADNLAETCAFGGLDESYGIIKSRGVSKNNKSYWSVTFAKARNLDGEIQVYNPNFIIIKWQTRYHHLPRTGQELFRNEDQARNFIGEKFVKFA